MRSVEVLIVGGGPAGASCARTLVKAGISCLVLDKQTFPRPKLCAGWITPTVFRDLQVQPQDYPGSLTTFPYLKVRLGKVPFIFPGTQYAIRRVEFDDWLLRSSGAEVVHHHVTQIEKEGGRFIIDGQYSADYLIGAGGTVCPVRRRFFSGGSLPRGTQIVSLEEEYQGDWKDPVCRLWFFGDGLPGYAWYVPKKDGFINLGIGANAAVLKQRKESIKDYWEKFVENCTGSGLVQERSFQPMGYTYYLQNPLLSYSWERVFLVGDALGLATLDMGEGIGPAVLSGAEAARAIIHKQPYNLSGVPTCSLLPRVFWKLLLNKQHKV